MSPRLFVGLPVPESIGSALCRAVGGALLAREGMGLQLYPERDLHLTLVFLGAVEARAAKALVRGLEPALQGLPAPRLRVRGSGAFPGRRSPRALWVAVREPDTAEALEGLRRAALGLVAAVGLPDEGTRSFRPHLTVARLRGGRGGQPPVPTAFWELEYEGLWVPQRVCLFESRPSFPEGRYAVLAEASLRTN